ncbi:hypothetical protein KFK09_011831 [Dendrobium nobile]|uniref:Uncharacterized protein n=1 Tax=Dendrobium nobile TaxID=94219 RepID=A0A8T3BDZ0_DENNO|nr:hypothetical protein KFK09_011831 [Dendrobium nobile]
MSAICGCSCSGGGAAISIAGSKLLCLSVPLRRYSLVIAAAGSGAFPSKSYRKAFTSLLVRASAVDSYENSSDFVKRMEQAWLISQVLVCSYSHQYFPRFLDFWGCEFICAIENEGF